jgi:predicted permease
MKERLLTDLRYALRLFARTPAWTGVAVMSLTLGIGANLLVFSIVDAVLLRPFPYRDPSRLVFIWGTKDDSVRRGISGLDLADWQAQNRSFESLDAFLGQMPFTVGDSGDSVFGACVGPSVLPMLGVQPLLGRAFVAADATPGADTVAMVSEGFWRSKMGGSPSAIGSPLRLNGRPYEVVGITPAGFFFPDTNSQILVSTPCGAPNFFQRGSPFAHAIARLRPDVSVAEAEGDLDRINRELAQVYPETNRNITAGVQPLRNIVIGKYEKALWLMLGAVGIVLLIACANVAHLQLARGVDRQTELAVRAANGADRRRLFAQLLTESTVLSFVSGGCALALAWWGVRVLRSLSLSDIARLDTARIDLRLASAAAALSLLSALVAGLWPAWKAAGVRINDVLKLGGSGATPSARRNLRELLATTELALATVLLIVAGLLIGSFVRLSRAQWGFDPNHLLIVSVMRPSDVAASPEGREQWTEAVRARIAAIPGVEAVASADGVPIKYAWTPTALVRDGRKLDWRAGGWTVSHGYFRTIGTPILEGREFSAADGASAMPVVVVSRALARKLWPGSSAVGQEVQVPVLRTINGKLPADVEARMRRGDRTLEKDLSVFDVQTRRVIGVVEDIRAFGLDLVPTPAFYIDYRQAGSFGNRRSTNLVVRQAGGAGNVVSDVKSIIGGGSFRGETRSVDSMSELVAHSIGGRGSNRLMMLVAMLFGGLALVLTTIGIFGVMLHTVTQRLPEMGVRVALGANRFDIARLVLGYAVRVLVTGLALGLTLTWVASRSLQSLLFELRPTDLPTYAGGAGILVLAVFLACALPVRRAVSFDAARLFRS